MQKSVTLFLAVSVLILAHVSNVHGQTSFTWNGAISSSLSEPLNWTPNGIPGDIDNITLTAAGNTPVNTDSVSYKNVTINGGNPDLGSYTIYVTGNLVLSGGTVHNGLLRVDAGAASTAVLTGVTIASDCILNIVTGAITISGGTYHGPVNIEQTGTVQTTGTGGATFNNTLSIINSGTGNFRMNGNVTYNGAVSFETRNTAYILPELTAGSTYNNDLTCTLSGSGQIRMAYQGTNSFNGNIILNSSNNSYIYFCEQGAATASLATGKTISAGSFTDGRINIYRFTQQGTTAQAISMSGTSVLTLGPAITFNAPLSVSAPQLSLNGGTYNNTATFSKTGATNNNSSGNNTFNDETEIINSGTGAIYLSYTTRDIYNARVTYTSTSSGVIYVAYNDASGTQFHDNILVNSTGTGGVRFGQSSGTLNIDAGKDISVGSTGFTSGGLYIRNFVQNGSDDVDFTGLTGTSAIYLQQGNIFQGNVYVMSPQVYLNGSTYNGNIDVQKTGATNNQGIGGNTFNGAATFNNTGTGYLMTGYGNADVFNADLVCNNSGAGIYFAFLNASATTQFNGNIELNNSGTNGIQFGQAAATSGLSVLASSKVITIGSGGFASNGFLRLRNFTQSGSDNLTLTLSGTAGLILGPGSTFNGEVNFAAPLVYLHGAVYNDLAEFTQTGISNVVSNGGNTFNSLTKITTTGSGYMTFANTTADQFNDNIELSSPGGGGIRFGQASATVNLASGKQIVIGSSGFTSGALMFRNFTQTGTTAQSFTLTGSASLYFQIGTTFNADITANAPQLFLNGSTFNGITQLSKTGATNNSGAGGNTFNGVTTLNNSGSGYLLTGNTSGDVFNDVLNLNGTGTGLIYLAHAAGTTYFNGDIYLNSTGSAPGIYFSGSNGYSELASNVDLIVGASGFSSGTLLLRHLTQLGTSAQSLTLTGTATLTAGPVSIFNAAVNFSSPQLNLNGVNFHDTAILRKTGAGNNTSTGGNVFSATATIQNSGSGSMTLAGTTGDDFNADAFFIQTGTGALYPAASTSSNFAADISTVGSTAAITFGQNANGRVVIDGNTAQSFNGPVAFKPLVRRLRMSTTGTLTLNVPVDISSDLNLVNGIINTSATNILTMTDESATANIGDAGSFINGPMRYVMNLNGTSSLVFPVGKGSDWRPMEFTPTHNSTTAYTYTVEMINSSAAALGYLPLPLTIDTVSDIRYWQVDRTPSINANLTSALARLYYSNTGNNDGVTDPSHLTVVKTNGAGTVWNDVGGTATSANSGNILSGSFNSSGLFTFGNLLGGNNALPIQLVSFNALASKDKVYLNWSTAGEINNDYFEVERSSDGFVFETVNNIDGAGNSTELIQYSCIDETPLKGVSYYRLRQVDYDGKFTYSKIVMVNFDKEHEINVYPNPINNTATFTIQNNGSVPIELYVYNAAGAMLKKFSLNGIHGIASGVVDFSDLPAGIYWINSDSGMKHQSVRLVKL